MSEWWVNHRRRFTTAAMIGIVVVALAAALISGWLARANGASNSTPVVERLPRADRGSGSEPSSSTTASQGVVAAGSFTATTVSTPPAPLPPPTLVVHAAGAVVNPGVYVFGPGARIADLVAAAGGLRPDADVDRVNLAAELVDASRVFVPRRGEPVPVTVPVELGAAAGSREPEPGGSTGASEPIDLNAATVEQLDDLPGVGPATAAAIVEHRTKIGRFRSIGQLLDVPGIGEAKLAALRSKVSV